MARNFWPEDTDKEIYLESSTFTTLDRIIDRAKEQWGADIKFEDLTINAEHIHTHCIGYDRYDSGDYTDFICITKK